jgi:muconolactone delta-isomerase
MMAAGEVPSNLRAMRYLVVVKRRSDKFTPAEFQPFLEPEAERARELYSQGVFRSIWTYAGEEGQPKGAVIDMDSDGPETVNEVLNTLPMALAGMIEWQILSILPYRGFAPRSSSLS